MAMAQTFSVHAGSLVPTIANVSAIWWLKPSSAAVSGPIGLLAIVRPLGGSGARGSSTAARVRCGDAASTGSPPPTV